ncbi:MAG TPA: MmgE/PrpD family protein [Thermoleophilaceae bacterium]|nr:MmgE/PrpD family protein [Thermoleophilaceae bacterium]
MPYRTAFLDWLACASAGREEPAARAAEAAGDGLLERVLSAGTAGHVLDFDDTYLPGLAHLSAPTAPAALVLGAALGRSVGEVVAAYTSGFEAMGAVARASHPALYDGGWHPTAVCGVVGAAISAAQLLGLSTERERAAVAIALLRAGGLRAAFGSDGKALQVGMAAAAGVSAARLAEGGASVPLDEAARGAAGFEAVFGASFAEPSVQEPAVRENWIKAWPCCLQIHGAIEAADRARADGLEPGTQVELTVHPISMEAARCGPQPADGLQAKFSIYYCTAFTLLHGPPGLGGFRELDAEAARLAGRVRVRTDDALLESEAVLLADGREVRVEAALGSPGHPLDAEALAAKLRDLGGERLVGVLDDPDRPASSLLEAAGLG